MIRPVDTNRTSPADSISNLSKDDIGVLLDNGQLPETVSKCQLFAAQPAST